MDPQALRFVPAHLRGLLCSSPVTFWRWCCGKSRAPRSALSLAQILVSGELLQGGLAWEGWRINTRTGELVDPDGQAHTPHGIRAWHWTLQELQRLRSEENQADNVRRIKTGRDGHAVTLELHRRLDDQ